MKNLITILLLSLCAFGQGSTARVFNGTSDCAQSSQAVTMLGNHGFTFYLESTESAFGSNDKLWAEASTNFSFNSSAYIVDPRSGGHAGNIEFDAASNSVNLTIALMSQPSVAQHRYAMGLDTASQTSVGFIDGVDQAPTIISSAGTCCGDYTVYFMSRACSSLFNPTTVFAAVLYNSKLSTAEAHALTMGVPPQLVRLPQLRFDVVMRGNSPEKDSTVHQFNWTLTGTTTTAGFPIRNSIFPQGFTAY